MSNYNSTAFSTLPMGISVTGMRIHGTIDPSNQIMDPRFVVKIWDTDDPTIKPVFQEFRMHLVEPNSGAKRLRVVSPLPELGTFVLGQTVDIPLVVEVVDDDEAPDGNLPPLPPPPGEPPA